MSNKKGNYYKFNVMKMFGKYLSVIKSFTLRLRCEANVLTIMTKDNMYINDKNKL